MLGTRRFVVRGLVQGVGFRRYTKHAALRYGLSGRVSNLEDGSVEVRVTGTEEQIQKMRECLGRGPMGSQVVSIYEEALPLDISTDEFEIYRY